MALSVREELHKMIDEADEERVNEIHDLLNDEGSDYVKFSSEDLAMLYARLEEIETGKSKSYTVEEAFEIARNDKK